MPSTDPTVRRLAGRVAAYSRVAGGPPKARPADAVIPESLRAAYHREVDPAGALTLVERQKRAAAAFRRDEAVAALDAYKAGQHGGDDAA